MLGNVYKGKVANTVKFSDDEKICLLTINNIEVGSEELEKAITEIALDKDNLFFVLNEENKTKKNYISILRSFYSSRTFPDDETIINYINKSIASHRAFYSFLAEMLQAILLRDICNYKLIVNVISYGFNPNLTKQGPDSCLYSEEDKKIVLGEAKFYESLTDAINNITSDFESKDSIIGKLESLLLSAESNPETQKIMFTKLGKTDMSDIDLKEFFENELIFSGFVLHNSLNNPLKYYEESFYDNIDFSVKRLIANIKASFKDGEITKMGNYKIVFFHLPIKDKRELIFKVIKKSISISELLKNENE